MSDQFKGVIPNSWAWIRLSELGTWRGGGTPSKARPEFWTNGTIPWVSPKDMKTDRIRDTEDHITEDAVTFSATNIVRAGVVLIVTRSGILERTLPIAVTDVAVALNQDLKALSPYKGIEPGYLALALRRFEQEILHLCSKSGTTVASVEFSSLMEFELPIAPTSEQRRIVAEVEKQLTDLDAGVAALKRVQANLKRYRASVLKAACEGRLVPTEAELAQIEGRDYESADKLLERIRREQSSRSTKHAPPNPNLGDLFPLPQGWCWTLLGSLLTDIQAGKSFKCLERPPQNSEVGVVKVSAVTWGKYDEEESKTCVAKERIDPDLYVREGDFLFSRANTIELAGACAIAGCVTKNIMLSDKILRFHFASVDPRWILWVLRSRYGRYEIERLATGNQESMRNIGQERIRQIRIPLPPLEEQSRIVAEIEMRASTVEKMKKTVETELRRALRLRQSILKSAFEGKLVQQDSKDEHASALLERIRQQRAFPPPVSSTPTQMALKLEEPKKPRTPRRRSASS